MDLPERMREAVWLWAQGLDSPAIGKRLGISPNTARVHVHHAGRRLAAAYAARTATP
ncbi:LuxR C-terminal-related transcriptional regulator [Actinacidiphila glaucinigra]|uniref:sigma factor-like helix-turn-helix DNA-binding protein n=1 Tax=Actinacidiphila glaucinigra TaxID=235986 RepID=UPI00386D8E65